MEEENEGFDEIKKAKEKNKSKAWDIDQAAEDKSVVHKQSQKVVQKQPTQRSGLFIRLYTIDKNISRKSTKKDKEKVHKK